MDEIKCHFCGRLPDPDEDQCQCGAYYCAVCGRYRRVPAIGNPVGGAMCADHAEEKDYKASYPHH